MGVLEVWGRHEPPDSAGVWTRNRFLQGTGPGGLQPKPELNSGGGFLELKRWCFEELRLVVQLEWSECR